MQGFTVITETIVSLVTTRKEPKSFAVSGFDQSFLANIFFELYSQKLV